MSVYQEKVKILKNVKVCGPYWKLTFESARLASRAQPGQFMLIRVTDGFEAFLRRPLGFHRIEKNIIEVLYEVVGRGTEILSERGPGEYLDVMGPLGKGFEYSAPATQCPSDPVPQRPSAPVLVAGGIGVAPLVFLAQKMVFKNCHSEPLTQKCQGRRISKKILHPDFVGVQDDMSKLLVLIGGRTKSHILCDKEFKDLGCEVRVATEDGSRGHNGFVTDLLQSQLSSIQYPVSSIYGCGPRPMLKETARIAARHKIQCQVLLEEYMACGIGVCLGCPVMTKDGYKLVCRDGPVFEAGDIIWKWMRAGSSTAGRAFGLKTNL